VYAKAHGYNPSEVSDKALTVKRVAMPTDVKLVDKTVSWNSVPNSNGYKIIINGVPYDAATNSFELNDDILTVGEVYDISVYALGATASNNSYVTDSLKVRYSANIDGVAYNASVLSWDAVIGADRYEVRVNDGAVMDAGNATSKEIELTAKENTVYVRMYTSADPTTPGPWTSYSVSAYEITLDTQGGKDVGKLYKANGDKIVLPDTERMGYTFNDWYTSNDNTGVRYTETVFSGSSDMTLYASWIANKYNVTLNFGNYGQYGNASTETVEVTYGQNFKFCVPDITDERFVFIGYNAVAGGSGTVFTDPKGVSTDVWGIANDVTIYATYLEVFKFTESVTQNGKWVVSAADNGYASNPLITELAIPAQYQGEKVYEISQYGFENCRNLISITIPDTITVAVAETMFRGCTALREFKVSTTGLNPTPVYSAKDGWLIYDENGDGSRMVLAYVPSTLSGDIVIPDGITYLGTDLFANNSDITSVTIPTSVTMILSSAFNNLANLTSVSFNTPLSGETLKTVKMSEDAIVKCDKLMYLTLPALLMDFDFGASVKDYSAIYGKYNNLKSISVVELADGVQTFMSKDGMLLSGAGDEILYCPKANETESVTIGSGINKIAKNAFANQKYLKNLTIGAVVSEIGERAFYNCKSLQSVVFEASLNANALTIKTQAFSGCSNLGNIAFNEECDHILDGVHDTDSGDEHTVSGATCNVVSIGVSAFSGVCAKSIVLPSTLTSIDNNAFSGNGVLTSLVLSHIDSGLVWGTEVFSGCSQLRTLNITDNVGVMEFKSIFKGCAINNFVVSENNPYYAQEDGVLYDKEYKTLVYIPDAVLFENGEYTIRNTVEKIGASVFAGREDLTKVIIPSSVTNIAKGAFENCLKLENVELANGSALETIEQAAFKNCELLGAFEFPASLTAIGNEAFINCYMFNNIVIPNGVASIGDSAFALSDASAEVIARSVTLGNGLTKIGSYAFRNNKGLSVINIPTSVTEIGGSAFANCGLTDIQFASRTSAESGEANFSELIVGEAVFAGNTVLSNVTLPEGLVAVSDRMFENCSNMLSVTIPTTVGNYFDESNAPVRGVGRLAFSGTNLSELVFILGGDKDLSFGEGFLKGTSVTVLNLPTRVAPFNGSYDVFAMGTTYNPDLMFIYKEVGPSPEGTTALTAVNIITEVVDGESGEKSLDLNSNGNSFASLDGVLYLKGWTEIVYCPSGKSGAIDVAAQVTSVRNKAFAACSTIIGLNFLDNDDETAELVLNVDKMFGDCVNLQSVRLPKQLTAIGDRVFGNMSSLNTVTFADNCKLKSIGKAAFYGTNISSIVLPSGVDTVGLTVNALYSYGPFGGCTLLSSVTVSSKMNGEMIAAAIKGIPNLQDLIIPPTNDLVKLRSGVIYDKGEAEISADEKHDGYRIVGVMPGSTPETLTVTADVYEIATSVFDGETALKNLVFDNAHDLDGNEVDYRLPLSILKSAFASTGISSVTLPERMVNLGDSAFYNSALTSLDFEDGYSYASIPAQAFRGTKLVSVTIPACVTAINKNAFAACSQLKYLAFEQRTATLELSDQAFYGCSALVGNAAPQNGEENVFVLPDTLKTMGESVFAYCRSLTKVEFTNYNDNTLSTVGKSAFIGCSNLKQVIFPDGSPITAIGDNAFDGLANLTDISVKKIDGGVVSYVYGIPNSIVTIGVRAFADCSSLGRRGYESDGVTPVLYDISILSDNSNVEKISNEAFANCTSLKKITIPQKVTSMGGSTSSSWSASAEADIFAGCSSLSDVTIADGGSDMYIGKSAFVNTAISEITLPARVTAIGDSIFEGLTSLTSVTFGTAGDPAKAGIQYIGKRAFYGTGIRNIDIPDSLKQLGAAISASSAAVQKSTVTEVFANCSSLTSVTINGSDAYPGITVIGADTFKDCDNLKTVNFGSKVDTIGHTAFLGCSGLTSIDLSYVRTLGDQAFKGCENLKQVTLDTLTSMGKGAFNGCHRDLKFVPVSTSGERGNVFFTQQGAFYTRTISATKFTKTELTAFYGSGELVIDSEATGIAANAVENNTAITALKIPFRANPTVNGLTSAQTVFTIGISSFKGCTNLQEIVFGYTPEGEDEVEDALPVKVSNGATGKGAFEGCENLTTVDFSGASEIGNYAFNGCENFVKSPNAENKETVDIKDVKVLGEYVFASTGVKDIELRNVTKIGNYAFKNTPLTSVTIPNSVAYTKSVTTPLGNSIFESCENLLSAKVNIGASEDNTKAIALPGSIFKYCVNLKEVTLSPNIQEIGSSAFEGCKGLKTVEFGEGSVLSTIKEKAFKGCAALEKLKLDSVTVLGSNNPSPSAAAYEIFSGCTQLKEISLPKVGLLFKQIFVDCLNLETLYAPKVTTMYYGAITNCPKLHNLVLGDNFIVDNGAIYNQTDLIGSYGAYSEINVINGVTKINERAFENNKVVKSIILPPSVTTIEKLAFTGSAIESINLEYVETVGVSAFANCNSLRSVNLSNLTNIDYTVFGNCPNLKSITVANGYEAENGAIYKNNVLVAVAGVPENFVVRDGTTEIAANVFKYNKDTVNKIEVNIAPVKSVKLPDSLKTIGKDAFNGNTTLESIDLNKVTTIGANAFKSCTALNNVTIPSTVTSLGASAFASCTSLTNVTIEEGITALPNFAFNASAITSIVIPSSVATLGTNIFQNCLSLKNVVIEDGNLKTISSDTFNGCKALQRVTIPDNVTRLDDNAFLNCTGIKYIWLSGNVQTVNKGVFKGWTNTQTIYFGNGTQTRKIKTSATAATVGWLQGTTAKNHWTGVKNGHNLDTTVRVVLGYPPEDTEEA